MKRILNTLSQKWPEYLLEILVLIIGIYGAFAVENWNEGRKERIEEEKLINHLIEAFELNLSQLEDKIQFRRVIVENALKINDYYDNPEMLNEDSLVLAISNIVHDPTFDPIDNNLLSSDNLAIIQNDELRSRLSNWSSDLASLQEIENAWQKLLEEKLNPYLVDISLIRDIVSLLFKNEDILKIWMLDKSLKDQFFASESKNKPRKEELLNNRKIEGYASLAVAYNQLANFQSYALRDKMKVTIKMLKREIE